MPGRGSCRDQPAGEGQTRNMSSQAGECRIVHRRERDAKWSESLQSLVFNLLLFCVWEVCNCSSSAARKGGWVLTNETSLCRTTVKWATESRGHVERFFEKETMFSCSLFDLLMYFQKLERKTCYKWTKNAGSKEICHCGIHKSAKVPGVGCMKAAAVAVKQGGDSCTSRFRTTAVDKKYQVCA